jgi:hypothetical protein
MTDLEQEHFAPELREASQPNVAASLEVVEALEQ